MPTKAKRGLLRKVVSWWTWLVAAWAPILSVYELLSKRHMVTLDLPHLLLFISAVAAVLLGSWVCSTLILLLASVVIVGVFTGGGALKSELVTAGLIVLAPLGGLVATIYAVATDPDKQALFTPKDITQMPLAGWFLSALGAGLLAWVYGTIFNQMKKALREEEDSKSE